MKKRSFLSAIFLFLLFANSYAQYWLQKGNDIDGVVATEYAGTAVSCSADGLTIVVGATGNSEMGMNAGQVRIYTWNGSSWVQKGSDINGSGPFNAAGNAVDISADGNTIIFGLVGSVDMGTFAGQARVYSWNGSNWLQKGINLNAEGPSNDYGRSVSISTDGNTIAIGAIGGGIGAAAGYAKIFTWSGTAWVQKGADLDAEAIGDRAGIVSLSADGDIIAIGAPNNSDSMSEAGHVRIFEWNGSLWEQRGADIDGDAAGDHFGNSVSLNAAGNVLAIGALENDDSGTDAGSVKVYSWNGSAWVQRGNTFNGLAAAGYMGVSVNINATGDVLAAGANYNDMAGTNAGMVSTLKWNGSAWVPVIPAIYGENTNDNWGYSVCLNTAGNVLVCGAPYNAGFASSAGHTRVYGFCSATTATVSPVSCHQYVSPSGNYTWSTSGMYTDTLTNAEGCDSMVTVNLTITHADTALTINNGVLTATTSGAAYQWLSCGSGQVIAGETGQSFTPLVPGYYALIITENGCTDTSACYAITPSGIGLEENSIHTELFPNPASGPVQINLGTVYPEINIRVINALGQVFSTATYYSTASVQIELPVHTGVYWMELTTPKGEKAVIKAIKK